MHYSVPMRQLLKFLFVQYISLAIFAPGSCGTSLRRSYQMVQDQEQGGVEAHKAHQEARITCTDYGSGAPGRSLPTGAEGGGGVPEM